MAWEEKITWLEGAVALGVPAVYFGIMWGRLADTSASAIEYQSTLLWAIGVSIALTVVGAILTGIGSGIAAELREEGSAKDMDRKDERDVTINRKGTVAGHYVSSGLLVGALALAMLEYDHFWIANSIYLAFVVGAFVTAVVKLVSYRRGF